MRILFAFAAFVAAIIGIAALFDGRIGEALGALAAAAVAGALLWRNLRDPGARHKGGHYATITFALEPGPGVPRSGTFAEVQTREHRPGWTVALDRAPQREDFDLYGRPQRGWVWLDCAGRPEKVRIDYGNTWKTWPVLETAAQTQGQT